MGVEGLVCARGGSIRKGGSLGTDIVQFGTAKRKNARSGVTVDKLAYGGDTAFFT